MMTDQLNLFDWERAKRAKEYVVAYASRTGTRRNLHALERAGWRLMISAKGRHRHEGMPHALDNGAWHSYCAGLPFDEKAFALAYEKFGRTADFVVLPDIVAGGLQSLDFSLAWRERLGRPHRPRACSVPQDTALIVSCAAGAAVDSALFLWLAFGNLDHILGQLIGKIYAVLAYAGVRRLLRKSGGEGMAPLAP